MKRAKQHAAGPAIETKARCRGCQSMFRPWAVVRPAHIVSSAGIGSGAVLEGLD